MRIFAKKFSIAALAVTVLTALPQFAAVSAASSPSPRPAAATTAGTLSGTVAAAASTVSGTVAAAAAPAGPDRKTAPAPAAEAPDRPVEIKIPSIALDDRIIPLGINGKGEMAVPSGKTSDIGWYEYGPVPGEEGSAVLDAHVFAALKNLKDVPVGADIYVTLSSGAVKHFVVRQSTVYALAGLPSSVLFDHGAGRWLNLITCAGQLTPDHSTYDHRLIVFAELVP